MHMEEYLQSILPSREDVDRFITKAGPDGLQPNRGWTYDAELGWVHANAVHERDGVGSTRTFYHYEPDGARRVVQGAGEPCRIHAYGNSMTHCDQVNDGETWAEFLAAHLQEPIRNYGVGGYSVYQAFRRMKKIHREGTHAASHVILDIFEDDHFRNLDSWRRLRHGRGSQCGYTLPHVRVHVGKGTCTEHENFIQARDDVMKLCDLDYVCQRFKHDPILGLVLATKGSQDVPPDQIDPVPISFGLSPQLVSDDDAGRRVRKTHEEAALFATRRVVQWVEDFCRDTNKKLLVFLSFGMRNLIPILEGGPRWDQGFADWIQTRSFPSLDMGARFHEAFGASGAPSPEAFLKPYFNGHHTPLGNFFTAWAIKDAVVQWLDPRPRPYRGA